MKNASISRALGLVIPLLFLACQPKASRITSVQQEEEPAWSWHDYSGKARTRADLKEIVRKHQDWLNSGFKSGERMDLSGADLTEADLNGEDLNGAMLGGAKLNGAFLADADLTDALLDGADLTGAMLEKIDLTGAMLTDANLADASIDEADLSNAQLSGANLDGTLFEPSSLPELRGMAKAKNLELITYSTSPDALFQLCKKFQDGGFRDQERKITYALKRREAELSWMRWTGRWTGREEPRAGPWSSDGMLANGGYFILNKVLVVS